MMSYNKKAQTILMKSIFLFSFCLLRVLAFSIKEKETLTAQHGSLGSFSLQSPGG